MRLAQAQPVFKLKVGKHGLGNLENRSMVRVHGDCSLSLMDVFEDYTAGIYFIFQ